MESSYVEHFIDHDLGSHLEELCGDFAPLSLITWRNMLKQYDIEDVVREIGICFPGYFPEFDIIADD